MISKKVDKVWWSKLFGISHRKWKPSFIFFDTEEFIKTDPLWNEISSKNSSMLFDRPLVSSFREQWQNFSTRGEQPLSPRNHWRAKNKKILAINDSLGNSSFISLRLAPDERKLKSDGWAIRWCSTDCFYPTTEHWIKISYRYAMRCYIDMIKQISTLIMKNQE